MSDTPNGPEAAEPDEAPDASTLRARVETVVIEDEMRSSYLDYAMSVIVGRALPDVRDGLKPVHRRILYSMFESGLRPDRPYRKCASAVGDVMKKYHPHGDSSIYDALVRMGQDFAIRAPLIDGHGNFGSIDGDPPAAMRYTESRLSKLAMELLRDIDENTVDFEPNYDGYEMQPTVLPARFPNLLVNGSTGIAVGMATNIPPHNLGEVIDATIAMIENPEITVAEIMKIVPAPDFPTGGLVLGQAGAFDAYTTGRGSVKVRAVCEIQENKGREQIVVTEIPYMVNKARMIEKIAQLVRDKVIEGISNVEDHSSREGLRVAIDIKRGANAQVVLNQLYKHTQLQDTFGCNMLALVDGVPKTLPLDAFLRHYIAHQVQVIRRRTEDRLRRAKDRAHILEGLLTALDHIDEIIAIIRGSESADAARGALQARFDFSDVQAQAILDMQLRRLAALERQKLQTEYDELAARIADYEAILADPERVNTIIKDELTQIKETYGDPRRSQIVPDDGAMSVEDLIPETNVVVTLTRGGYVKRTPQDAFKEQNRGGKGVRGADMKEDDVVETMITCSTHDHLLVFTNEGRVYRIKTYAVPEKNRSARGVYVANVPGLTFEPDERVAAVLALKTFQTEHERYLVFATRNGRIKRSRLADYDSPRSVLIAINLAEDDELIGVKVTDGQRNLMLISREGQSIRFAEDDARAMGRGTGGVTGMKLSPTDEVLALLSLPPDDEKAQKDHYVLTISENGYGKRSYLGEYGRQNRGGKGIKTHALTEKTGPLAGALLVGVEAQFMMIGSGGTVIRTSIGTDRDGQAEFKKGRATQGVRMMRLGEGSRVIGIAPVLEDIEDASSGDDGTDQTDTSVAPNTAAAGTPAAPDATSETSDEPPSVGETDGQTDSAPPE